MPDDAIPPEPEADAGFTMGEPPRDVLDGLAERAAADRGAPFAPDVIARLIELRRVDRAAFEVLRAKLRKAGVRVTALDAVMAQNSGDEGTATQADLLVQLAETADLFHAPDLAAYADVVIGGHRETWPVRSRGFKRWLTRRFFEEVGGAPNADAINAALSVIEAKAHYDGPERSVAVRVASAGGQLYLDLADDTWRAIEINADGWRIVAEPPVRFRRSAGMLPLPEPQRGGSIQALRPFLNVSTDQDFILAVAWLLAELRDIGPYPVLVLAGEHGSAKTTFARLLRALIDPSTTPLRALPREDRDLFIAAVNVHVLAFDNVSGLPPWISDTLCRLSTGGGFAVRTLYTDGEETLFDAVRPIILNGIEDVVTRPDLADRSLFLTLNAIPEESRKPERELWAEFEAERPRILGALLGAVVHGLRMLPRTKLPRLPRLANFALWATACEGAAWQAGTFIAAYEANRQAAVLDAVEHDPVAVAVRAFMADDAREWLPDRRTVWTGNAETLLGALKIVAGEAVTKAKTWPTTPRALSGRLRRAATFLRKLGTSIEFPSSTNRTKRARNLTITSTAAEEEGARPSPPSPPSPARFSNGLTGDGRGDARPSGIGSTVTRPASGDGRPGAVTVSHAQPSPTKPLRKQDDDGGDGGDAKIPTSRPEQCAGYAEASDGAAALHRPPSWSDPDAPPSPGCRCRCCGGQAWWCERQDPRGWRCSTCHPPPPSWPPDAVRQERT